MLKTRIIPTLLWKDYGLVKGSGFDSQRRIGTIMPAIKVYNKRQVDELIISDITATNENREPDYTEIKQFSKECFLPLTMAGGINSLDTITKLLFSGADKVAINTAAYENKIFISNAANRFGSQSIVVSIDAKKHGKDFYCYSHSGQKNTYIKLADWAQSVESMGAGEIIITSVERDGTMEGYDLEMIQTVTDRVKIPVIASGGAGDYNDFYAALIQSKANAVAAASMFHFTEQTPMGAKRFLAQKGINVRDIKVLTEAT